MTAEASIQLSLVVFLHRTCMKPHPSLGDVRRCHGGWAVEGIDYKKVTTVIDHPWPEDGNF